jgi:hypothetical protein
LLEILRAKKNFFVFMMAVLFFSSLATILFELALTRIFSIILWYDYAFMAISVAFFGLGIGSLLVHMQKDYGEQRNASWLRRLISVPAVTPEAVTKKIIQYSVAYALSVPAFIFAVTQLPPDPSFVYLFYLASSIPFFFVGSIMALIFFAMPRQINRLYFADLVGAASAAIILDPLMRGLGAEPVLLFTALLVAGSAIIGGVLISRADSIGPTIMRGRQRIYYSCIFAGVASMLVLGSPPMGPAIASPGALGIDDFLKVDPGPNKGLYWQLKNPHRFEHLSTQWNSFSRIDVTKQILFDDPDQTGGSPIRNAREHANIIIDADAGTPIYEWSGNKDELGWMRQYMDHLPYEIAETENVLVIGSGGGQDVMMALAGGASKVTAVEINPMIVSAVQHFGAEGSVYGREDVELFVDDGRRFIGSSAYKYDVITIKLVDSWAAQLAGGYALSENYLYTSEAFQQYIRHLDGGDSVLAMIRWNFELPRLMPVLADALEKETGKSREEISRHIIVIEDRPGLYFGRVDDSQTHYPVLVMVKATPFTEDQIGHIRERVESDRADVMMLGDRQIAPPYDMLFATGGIDDYNHHVASVMGINPRVTVDDSPFYFARDLIPSQMISLLATVLGISAGLCALLVRHARKIKTGLGRDRDSRVRSAAFVLFAIFIGLGFMILQITFIQKFLLLLGTPIMALTVILFSILLSSRIGAYVSGRLFRGPPHKAVFVSVPALAGMVLFYLFSLQGIIDSAITMDLPARAAVTFVLLSAAGLLMGFQFPALIRMASSGNGGENKITLLWGINVIASIVGTVLAALLAMIIGFNWNLVVGLAMYVGAGASAYAAFASSRKYASQAVPVAEREGQGA